MPLVQNLNGTLVPTQLGAGTKKYLDYDYVYIHKQKDRIVANMYILSMHMLFEMHFVKTHVCFDNENQ